MRKQPHQSPKSALLAAIAKAGGQAALARKLKVKPQAVHQWVEAGRAPVMRTLDIEAATGIRRNDLRPDVYP